MSAITTESPVLSDLRKQITEDLQLWEKTADKVKTAYCAVTYRFIADKPSPEIDVFDLKKNSNKTVLYEADQAIETKPSSFRSTQKFLGEVFKLCLLMEKQEVDSQQAVRVTLDFFKNNTFLKRVEYIRKW